MANSSRKADSSAIRRGIEATDVLERLARPLDAIRRDLKFIDDSRERLCGAFADQWIAVRDEAVIAHAEALDGLRIALAEKHIDPASCVIEFMPASPPVLIL